MPTWTKVNTTPKRPGQYEVVVSDWPFKGNKEILMGDWNGESWRIVDLWGWDINDNRYEFVHEDYVTHWKDLPKLPKD